MKYITKLFISALLVSGAAVSQGAPTVPADWKVAKKDDGAVIILAVHQNNGGLGMLREAVSDFDSDSIESLLNIKIQNFEVEHGISERTSAKRESIGDGIESVSATFRVSLPDGKGAKIDTRYRVVVYKEGDEYITILQSCRFGSESKYSKTFSEFLQNLKKK